MKTEGRPDLVGPVVLFAPEGQIIAGGGVAQSVAPIHRLHQRFDLLRAQPRGIEPPDNGAEAGSGNVVDGDVQRLQDLKHPHMGRPSRTAAAQHQTDAGAVQDGRWRGLLGQGQG